MSLFTLLLGALIGSSQTRRALAQVEHARRTELSQEMDTDLTARRQTGDLMEWLNNPETTDYVGVDDPLLSRGIYEPWREFEGGR